MEFFWGAVWAIAPTILVGLVFWFIVRAIVRADKTERAVAAKYEAEERAKYAAGLAENGSTRSG